MISIWHWHTEPLLIGSLLFVGWLFAVLTGPLRHRFADAPSAYPSREACCFAAGLIVFYLAVGSPLDVLGENFLFSAHMVQHKIVMYIAPVLLLFGIPTWLIDALFRQMPATRDCWRFLVHPVVAGALFTLAFSLWHIPAAYEAALVNKAIHAIEHLTMFGAAVLLWWAFISPSRAIPAISPGARILYIFAITVLQIPVFVYLTFSGDVHYPTYEFAPRIIALDPLEDQILGGIIMKASGMFVAIILIGCSFYAWSRDADPRSEDREARRDPGVRGARTQPWGGHPIAPPKE